MNTRSRTHHVLAASQREDGMSLQGPAPDAQNRCVLHGNCGRLGTVPSQQQQQHNPVLSISSGCGRFVLLGAGPERMVSS